MVSNPSGQDRLTQLKNAAGSGPVLILTHDNPDPDAIATGWAIHFLIKECLDRKVRLVAGGAVVRAEFWGLLVVQQTSVVQQHIEGLLQALRQRLETIFHQLSEERGEDPDEDEAPDETPPTE